MQDLDYYYKVATEEGVELNSELQFTAISFDFNLDIDDDSLLNIYSYRDFIEENYKIAQKVPIDAFEEKFEDAKIRSCKKLEELLAQVRIAYNELKQQEIQCEIEVTPIADVSQLLMDLICRINDTIYIKRTAQGKKPLILLTFNGKLM